MSGRLCSGVGVLFLIGSYICTGCAGSLVGRTGALAPDCGPAASAAACASGVPHESAMVPEALPGLIQTIYANGIFWIGYNVGTAEGGDLDVYDAGEGLAVGLGFGNGEDLMRFFEITYENTGGHEYLDESTPPGVMYEASHERISAGLRRYLFPVSETSGRLVPFLAGGVTFQTINGTSDVVMGSGKVKIAQGMGLYLGTGLELYLGTSSQVALAVDVRGSVIKYDGTPEGTGTQATLGSSLYLVVHF